MQHPGPPTPAHLLPALYWGRSSGERPQDFVSDRVPAWWREAIALVLKNGADAHPGIAALGWADCRICGGRLGSGDLTSFGFVWPEKAEHYVVAHGVWTPACSEILHRALSFPVNDS